MTAFKTLPVFGITYDNPVEAMYQHIAARAEALCKVAQTAEQSARLMERVAADWFALAPMFGLDYTDFLTTSRHIAALDCERWSAAGKLPADAVIDAALMRALTPAGKPCVWCGGPISGGPAEVCHECAVRRGAELAYEARRDGTAEDDGADIELQPCVRCGQAIEAGPVNVCEECANYRPPADGPDEDRISPAIADGLVVNDEGPAEDPANYATEAEYYGGLLSEPLAPAGAPLTALEADALFQTPGLDALERNGATAVVERALPAVLDAAERLCDDVIAGIDPELQAVYERPAPTGFREARRAALGLEAVGTGRCKHGYATDQSGESWCAACRLARAGIAVVELPPVLISASDIFQGADAAEFGERVDAPFTCEECGRPIIGGVNAEEDDCAYCADCERTRANGGAPRVESTAKPAAHPIVAWLSEEARRVGSDLREQLTRLGY